MDVFAIAKTLNDDAAGVLLRDCPCFGDGF
jgi:hypothetical protein